MSIMAAAIKKNTGAANAKITATLAPASRQNESDRLARHWLSSQSRTRGAARELSS